MYPWSDAIGRNDAITDIYDCLGNKTEAVVVVVDPLTNSKYLKGCSMVRLPTSSQVMILDAEMNNDSTSSRSEDDSS